MKRKTKIIAAAAAGLAVVVSVGAACASSASASESPCAVTTNTGITIEDFFENDEEAMVSPPQFGTVGVGLRTPYVGNMAYWQITPRYPVQLGKVRWFAYQTFRYADSTDHNPAVRVVLADDTVLTWVPSYSNVAEKWVARKVSDSATWKNWLLDHGHKQVRSYGVSLGPNTTGAHTRFNVVTFRTDAFCDQNRWVKIP
jgi:hypothetical protein